MNTIKSMGVMLTLVLGMSDTYAVVVAPGRIVDSLTAFNAQDKYQFKCPYGTVAAVATVTDANENPLNINSLMFVTLNKRGINRQVDILPAFFGGRAVNGEDGVQGVPSPPAVLREGPGVYDLIFSKSAAGFENYRGNVFCFLPRSNFSPLPIQIQDTP